MFLKHREATDLSDAANLQRFFNIPKDFLKKCRFFACFLIKIKILYDFTFRGL